MDFIQAIILGIVEGITEFLPISSTFHLIFASKLMGIQQSEFTKLFEVFIQSGAILSVIILYFREIIRDRDLMLKTLVAFLPTAVIGLILYKVIKTVFFNSPILMLVVFVAMGLVFIITENLIKKGKINLKKNISNLSYKEVILIGVIQSLAVVPGVSRAGAVLIGMMVMSYKRDESAKFSFILAVPTILAASALDLLKSKDYLMSHTSEIVLLMIGFVAALISSYIVIKWFIKFLKTNSLVLFGYYRFIVAAILLLLGLQ